MRRGLLVFLVLSAYWSGRCAEVLRVGHFPNLTHAQALIGHYHSRATNGWFERYLPGVPVEWHVFNAGPSAMEAILTGAIDLAYVGPNPAINAHLRTKGEEIRIVAGACSGGSYLVVQADGRIRTEADLRGKKIATPQLGNTQDVAARTYFRSQGMKVTLTGGDLFLIPTANSDQLLLFAKGDLDAVWTIEPWVSRIESQAKGKIFLAEKDVWPQTNGRYVTTHLVASTKVLRNRSDVVKRWLQAHVELTQWANTNSVEARRIANAELKNETRRDLSPAVLDSAWARIELTHDPVSLSLRKSADDAFALGFIKHKPDLSRIYELQLLNAVLTEKGLSQLN
jgi:NitT/TauT family transport system substrate-binding protein